VTSDKEPDQQLQQFALVSNPVFRRLFFIIRVLGCLIMVANTITEYAYLFKHEFSSILFFALYLGTTALKLIIPFVILLTWIKRQVISKVPKSFCSDMDQEQRIRLTRVYQKQGASLYTAIPLFYITGSYRLMGCTNFTKEITIGFILDFMFTLAMVFIQSINNATLS
jgi:hypothetical protein